MDCSLGRTSWILGGVGRQKREELKESLFKPVQLNFLTGLLNSL